MAAPAYGGDDLCQQRDQRRCFGGMAELAGLGVDQFAIYLMHVLQEKTMAACGGENITAW